MKTLQDRLNDISIERHGLPYRELSPERQVNIIEPLLKETTYLLLEATQNLGHPAYGVSSGTTFHIDELREKCFDFLGVPNEVKP